MRNIQFNDYTSNKDLVWNLGDKNLPERTVQFLKRFENTLCLFSGSVRQLYSNYEIHPIAANDNKAVALPNPRAYHDTYSHVTREAIRPTGLFIAPSEAANDEDSKQLHLIYKSSKTGKFKSLPLEQGMRQLQKKFKDKGSFLPVILSTDLKFKLNNQPVMHLHRVDVDSLEGISEFQKKDIARAIEEKLSCLF